MNKANQIFANLEKLANEKEETPVIPTDEIITWGLGTVRQLLVLLITRKFKLKKQIDQLKQEVTLLHEEHEAQAAQLVRCQAEINEIKLSLNLQ